MKRMLSALPLLAAVLLWPLQALSQGDQAGAQQPAPSAQQEAHQGGKALERRKPAAKHHGMMKAAYDRAMAELQAMDARLDEKVAAMNAASGDQKVAAMAAVINELVAQRKEMRDKMAHMHHHKMERMRHEGYGKPKGGCVMEGQPGGTGKAASEPKSPQ